MNKITIPAALRDSLPADLDLTAATIATYGALCDEHDLRGDEVADIAADAIVVIAPGYIADDGNAEVEYLSADSAQEAAREYVDGGDWGECDETSWITVYVWRVGYVIDRGGDVIKLKMDRNSHTVTLEAEEPECADGDDHDWRSPHSVVGGVYGHGGGVVITEVCAHCGRYRVTDTWAQDMETGGQGLESVEYRDADDASMEWVEALRAE